MVRVPAWAREFPRYRNYGRGRSRSSARSRWRTATFLPGEIETLPFKGLVVNLHLSAPHRLVQRQHDLAREGLVATNNVAVTPAGVTGYWRTDAASEDMSMLLEDRFIRGVTRESDVDPDRIEVVPLFSAPDPQIGASGSRCSRRLRTGDWEAGSTPSRSRLCWRCICCETTPRWDAAPGRRSGVKAASPNARSGRPPIT